MTDHTPTPWTSHNDIDGSEILFAGDPADPEPLMTIGRIYTGSRSGQRGSGVFPDWDEGMANSSFIVRACNSHAALLEACKLAEARPPVDDTDIAIRDTLRAAIALAGQEWVACRECIHCDDLEGGCAVDVDVWESNLKPKYDYIYCGSFESRLGQSPESAGPADVQ